MSCTFRRPIRSIWSKKFRYTSRAPEVYSIGIITNPTDTDSEQEPNDPKGSAPYFTYLWYGCTLGVVIALQLYYFFEHIEQPALWRDEANSLAIISLPLRVFFGAAVQDVTGFSYLIPARMWCFFFGATDVSIRTFSLALVLLANLCILYSAKRWFTDLVSTCCTVFLAGLIPLILELYIGHGRPYACTFFYVAIGLERYTALQARYTTFRLWTFGLSLLLLCNALPSALPVAGVLCLLWFRHALCSDFALGDRIKRALVVAPFILLAPLPLLFQSWRFSQSPTDYAVTSELSEIPGTLYTFTLGQLEHILPALHASIEYVFDDYIGGSIKGWIGPMPLLLQALTAIFGMGLFLYWFRHTMRKQKWLLFDTLLLWAVPVVLLLAGSLFDERMINIHKTVPSTALGTVFLAVMILRVSRPLLILLTCVTVFRITMAFPVYQENHAGRLSDARTSAELIQEQARTEDVILLANPQLSPAFSYYYKGENQQIHHPYTNALTHWNALQLAEAALQSNRLHQTISNIEHAAQQQTRVWFLTSGSPAPEPDKYWYFPNDLPEMERQLNELFQVQTNWVGSSRFEPFEVFLYAPKVAKP